MALTLTFLSIFTTVTIAILVFARPNQKDPMTARFEHLQRRTWDRAESGYSSFLKQASEPEPDWNQLLLARLAEVLGLRLLFLQGASSITTGKFLLQSFGAGMVSLLVCLLFLQLPLVALAAAGVGSLLPWFVLNFRRSQRIDAFSKALPGATDTIARSLRAGNSLVAAISVVGEQAAEPARGEFAEVFRQLSFGLPLREALLQLLDRAPSQDLRVLVSSILVQKDSGGDLTKILDRTSEVIRERQKLAGDIRVHTAQGRMTGWVLCIMPLLMFAAIKATNPGYFGALTGTPLGHKILYIGIVLLGAGALLIKRIISGIDI